MIEVQLYTGRTDPDVEFEGTLDSGIRRVLFANEVRLLRNGMTLVLPGDRRFHIPVFDDMLQIGDRWFGDAMIANAASDKALYVHSFVPSSLGFPVIRRMSSIVWTYNTVRPYPYRNDDDYFFLQGMEYPVTIKSRGYDNDHIQAHALS